MKRVAVAALVVAVGLPAGDAGAASGVLSPALEVRGSAGMYGTPVFLPDGEMMYIRSSGSYAVFARDPRRGTLSRLGCETESGGDRCPRTNSAVALSPDGNWLYTLNGSAKGTPGTLRVFARGRDGALTLAQCLGNVRDQDSGCDPVLPTRFKFMALSEDGEALHVASSDTVMRLARDQTSGTLAAQACSGFAGKDPCDYNYFLKGITQLVTVAEDVYVLLGKRIDGVRFHPETGRLHHTTITDRHRIGEIARSPDGRRLYAVHRSASDLYSFSRDADTGELGAARCIPAGGNAVARRRRCPARTAARSGTVGTWLAVSPDGETVVTGLTRGSPSPHAPHPYDELVTFQRTHSGQLVSAGCIGDRKDCDLSIGSPRSLAYAPDGRGAYLVTGGGIRLLAPAPMLRLGDLALIGRNRAFVTCPSARSRDCRGTIRMSQVTFDHYSGATYDVHLLTRVKYRVGPGATRGFALPLDLDARQRFLDLAEANRERGGPPPATRTSGSASTT